MSSSSSPHPEFRLFHAASVNVHKGNETLAQSYFHKIIHEVPDCDAIILANARLENLKLLYKTDNVVLANEACSKTISFFEKQIHKAIYAERYIRLLARTYQLQAVYSLPDLEDLSLSPKTKKVVSRDVGKVCKLFESKKEVFQVATKLLRPIHFDGATALPELLINQAQTYVKILELLSPKHPEAKKLEKKTRSYLNEALVLTVDKNGTCFSKATEEIRVAALLCKVELQHYFGAWGVAAKELRKAHELLWRRPERMHELRAIYYRLHAITVPHIQRKFSESGQSVAKIVNVSLKASVMSELRCDKPNLETVHSVVPDWVDSYLEAGRDKKRLSSFTALLCTAAFVSEDRKSWQLLDRLADEFCIRDRHDDALKVLRQGAEFFAGPGHKQRPEYCFASLEIAKRLFFLKVSRKALRTALGVRSRMATDESDYGEFKIDLAAAIMRDAPIAEVRAELSDYAAATPRPTAGMTLLHSKVLRTLINRAVEEGQLKNKKRRNQLHDLATELVAIDADIPAERIGQQVSSKLIRFETLARSRNQQAVGSAWLALGWLDRATSCYLEAVSIIQESGVPRRDLQHCGRYFAKDFIHYGNDNSAKLALDLLLGARQIYVECNLAISHGRIIDAELIHAVYEKLGDKIKATEMADEVEELNYKFFYERGDDEPDINNLR